MSRPLPLLLCAFLLATSFARAERPEERHARAPRVLKARAERMAELQALFHRAGMRYPAPMLFLRAFKHEGVLELWGGEKGEPLRLVHAFPICARSGRLGLKRQQGDLMVPEGFYRIDRLNPYTSYHLSLGIDYPNTSDHALGRRSLGGDIFIHGDCVTIGCIPIEDGPMERLFLAVLDHQLLGF